MTRRRLPARRPQTVLAVEHSGSVYTVGTGHYLVGRPGELFISTDKVGSELDALLNDAAILASRCLQFGDTLDGLSQAMGRCGDQTRPASAIGAVLDMAARR